MRLSTFTLVAAGFLALSSPVAAQPVSFDPIPVPAQPGAITLATGGVAGMPPEVWFKDRGATNVRNVSAATLTPFLPPTGKATGAAVIVAPGGAFLGLAMDKEGWAVARLLADQGIAAFVLKYRLNPTPEADAAFQDYLRDFIARARTQTGQLRELPVQALEDGLAALNLVRQRAGEWGVDPKRIGIMGFSAGAMTALATTLQAPAGQRPAFVAPIYGPMGPVVVPGDAPPLYVALSADDHLFGNEGFGLVESWRKAGAAVELHYFQKGGHGFGLGQTDTTTQDWVQGFVRWLRMNGVTG